MDVANFKTTCTSTDKTECFCVLNRSFMKALMGISDYYMLTLNWNAIESFSILLKLVFYFHHKKRTTIPLTHFSVRCAFGYRKRNFEVSNLLNEVFE